MMTHGFLPHSRPETETISISIGVGSDSRTASSIVLPRGHDLVKHLERLLPAMTKAATYPPRPQQHDAVRGLASLSSPYQMSVNAHYNHLPASYDMHPHSPYHSDSSSGNRTPSGSFSSDHMAVQYTGVRRRRGPAGAQGAGKKCQFPNCEKISVSRGLCRGHGGGRRCQHAGCSKGAQSRSDFCWAHGGGQRCEVKNCMRSRKSKRFCVAHLSWEGVVSNGDGTAHHGREIPVTSHRMYEQPKTIMPKPAATYIPEIPALASSGKLPSLQQALLKNQCMPTAVRPGFVHSTTAVLS
ncbi:hypothetical protein FI667_g15470, partial [Globisporangium splendens]